MLLSSDRSSRRYSFRKDPARLRNTRAESSNWSLRLLISRRMPGWCGGSPGRRQSPWGGACPAFQLVSSSVIGYLVSCLLYTSDAADEEDSVDLGGRRIIKK